MIVATGLSKRYGSRTAVDGISFEVPRGQIVGFLGPNGAGKSTTLKMVAGFLPPTEGTVTIDGLDAQEDSLAARAKLGYMPETVPVYPELRVEEFLSFRAEIKGVRATGSKRKKAVERAMELTKITDRARWLVGELSKGLKQRVALADAIVADPPVLVLDEPTASLDPNQIIDVRELIRSLGGEHTIVLSTHILPEVEATCSRVIILSKGRVAAQGTMDEIRARLSSDARGTSFVFRGEIQAFRDVVARVEGVSIKDVTTAEEPVRRASLAVDDSDGDAAERVERLVSECVAAKLGVREVTLAAKSLEDVFRELTTKDRASDESDEETKEDER
ncbi:MAG: ABC transporter ATP-binding protein [Myxococcales bacterium]|nr:ABC transporter ATP-binding protein [Myxococcales bacterium]